jgi:isocitrate dehydrogenase
MNQYIKAPQGGSKVTLQADGMLKVPSEPIIPYIVGDGAGLDISPVMRRVVDAAVANVYGTQRRIHWMEIFAGQSALLRYGPNQELPQETLDLMQAYVLTIKGPLAASKLTGRSLNVSIRQALDLYACVRPVQYFAGVPAPVKAPERINMVIFRENSEDIYAGAEFCAETTDAKKLMHFLTTELGVRSIRFPNTSSLGIKPVSKEGTRRLIRKAIQYAIDHDRPSVTLVHKSSIMHSTEGGFRLWAYQLAQTDFQATLLDGGPWCRFKNPKTDKWIVINDVESDVFMQQILLRPAEFSVVATLNLNGDYISSALAAQVGAAGMAPSANLSDSTAVFESTHGTLQKYAGKDYVNPSSAILAAEMMLRFMGWIEAANLMISAITQAIMSKHVTYDLARLMDGATQVSCSGFGDVMIAQMETQPS